MLPKWIISKGKGLINCLKFDFYKIKNSKNILIITGVSLLVEFFVFISQFVLNSSKNTGALQYLANKTNNLDLLIILFTVLFVCKDFSSGYVRNFYNEVGKFEYVLSKFIVIVLYAILYQFIFFLMTLIFVYFFGAHCIYYYRAGDTAADVWEELGKAMEVIISLSIVGFITATACFLFKKEYIVFLILLSWMLYLQYKFFSILREVLWQWPSLRSFDVFDLRVFSRNNYRELIPRIMAITSATVSFLWSYLLYRNKKI